MTWRSCLSPRRRRSCSAKPQRARRAAQHLEYQRPDALTNQCLTRPWPRSARCCDERHRVTFQDDFSVSSQQDILDTANQITGVLTLFLGGVAGISLLVGGIGIMNIMLVSVTERTREIGLRKAVGARKRDILSQFLTEAAFLSLVGGIIGIALGWGMSRLMGACSSAVQPSRLLSDWMPCCWQRCSQARSACSLAGIRPGARRA